MSGHYLTVSEFIEEFRRSIGDTTCEIPETSIMAWLNAALRRFARSKGLDKLFRYQDTFELAPMNKDGSKSAAWFLRGAGEENKNIGMILNIESLLILDTDTSEVIAKDLCYMPFEAFRREYPFPEQNDCLSHYTVNVFGGDTKIMFNAPIEGHFTLDMVYTAFHPRITSANQTIRIPYAYLDIVIEGVKILQAQESADYATARALYEDWDFLIAEARELLAQQHTAFGLRYMRASF